jgi:hypothetical protein
MFYCGTYEGQIFDAYAFAADLVKTLSVYHLGASLKDLGKKLFAFSKMEAKPAAILKGV